MIAAEAIGDAAGARADTRKRVLVLGSGGYIGRRVMAALRARGAAVTGADLFAAPGSGDEVVDVRFPAQTMALVARVRPEVVICLSYLITPQESNTLLAVDTNISGITGVFEACAVLGVPRVIYASTSAVYGGTATHGNALVAEDAPTRPLHLYGWMKHFNEITAAHYNRTSRTRFVGVRI